MHKPTLNAIFLIAACLMVTAATAQNAYKCGNSYSQSSCPGGISLDTRDPRSLEQKNQTDLASARDARVADSLEKTRLAKEKKDRAANTPSNNPSSADLASFDAASNANPLRQIKKGDEYFTAQIPGEKKKKTRKTRKTQKGSSA